MSQVRKDELKKYIQKVLDDAFTAESRPNDGQFSAYIADGDTLILFLSTKYCSVQRRVRYRLKNNLPKNFGISLCHLQWSGRNKPSCENDDLDQSFTVRDSCVEAGYTVAQIKEWNRLWFVNVTAIGKKKNLLPCGLNAHSCEDVWAATDEIKKQLMTVGGQLYYYTDLEHAFETYLNDFKKAYGHFPPTITVEHL